MIVDGCCVKSDGDMFLVTIETKEPAETLAFLLFMGKVDNKLANYIVGAYYVYTTPGFPANAVPTREKQKNPLSLYCPRIFVVTPYAVRV